MFFVDRYFLTIHIYALSEGNDNYNAADICVCEIDDYCSVMV